MKFLAQLLVDLIQALSGKILAFSGVDYRTAAFDPDKDDVTRLDFSPQPSSYMPG
ncbi:hypothetical protein LOB21_00280 [Lactobacillus delbrueckii subsp. lactis]|uniref:hypothetical protein n=1 Tax=Lactobacillus delbrueckii TaxID=1584 RepID=UPI001E5DB7E8|nr:hypothetical protein [Lactobacillus delbrueckii]MCD5433623.1 hypothetical protein [Lactobacillus delbrueckii subsp. lactis]